jgi:hypothetical protein
MHLATSSPRHRLLADSVTARLRRGRERVHAIARATARRVTTLSSDRWFLIGLVAVLLLFLTVLMIQPSSVGRGGR